MDYSRVSTANVTIGTQLYTQLTSDTAADARLPEPERITLPGADGTLLAIVPIPGTQTSLAIVGYAISTAGAPPHPARAEPPQHDVISVTAGPDQTPEAAPAPITLGDLHIDPAQRRVQVNGAEVALTFQEFELLAFLSAHPAVVFSRADLVQRVWQQPQDTPDRPNIRLGTRTVDVHVSRLRRKLGPVYGQCLVTEHRAGYQFRPPAA
jgi:DNA-binding winged helix-turn-helix (wHTH) protein